MAVFISQSMLICRSFSVFRRCPLLCAIQKNKAVTKKDDKFTVGKEKPKKPSTPFYIFWKEHCDSVKQQNPQSNPRGILASLWKELPDSEKQKYILEYEAQREEYIDLMYQYYQETKNNPGESENLLENKKFIIKALQRKMGKPTHPNSVFFKFLKEYSAKTGKSFQNSVKEGKEKWAELSDKEKEKYFKEAKLEREKYRQELLIWEKKMFEDGHYLLVRMKSAKEFKNLTAIDP